jgi:hypothetical protein
MGGLTSEAQAGGLCKGDETARRRAWGGTTAADNPHQASSRTLLLTPVWERELREVDGLLAGSASSGPAAQDGLEEQHRLRERQAGCGAFGSSRSSVRKAWAQVTSAVW